MWEYSRNNRRARVSKVGGRVAEYRDFDRDRMPLICWGSLYQRTRHSSSWDFRYRFNPRKESFPARTQSPSWIYGQDRTLLNGKDPSRNRKPMSFRMEPLYSPPRKRLINSAMLNTCYARIAERLSSSKPGR